jgi:hypothetical protein
MFGAAISGAFGGGATGGNGFAPQFDMAGFRAQGGSLFDIKGMTEFSNNQNQQRSEDIYQQSNANAQTGRVSQSYATGTAPNIPMSDSYNAVASAPVFPPAAQEQAAAVFGSNNERQGSTSGFKQEVKDRIIGDLNSL